MCQSVLSIDPMQTVNHPDLRSLHEAATDNIIDFYRYFSLHLDGAHVLDEADLFYAATGIPDAMMNGVFRTRLETDTADARIDSVIEYFKGRDLPYQWWVSPYNSPGNLTERLSARGFVCETDLPGMAVSIDEVVTSSPSAPLVIERVSDRETMISWIDTLIEACNMPRAIAPYFLKAQDSIGYGKSPTLLDFAGFRDGKLVATTTVYLAAEVAAIYCVGTLPEDRRKGYASAMVAHALRRAREEGYRFGALQASRMGHPVYERMGFRDTGHYKLFSLPSKHSVVETS